MNLDVGCGWRSEFSQRRGNIRLDINKPDDKMKGFVLGDAHYLPFRSETFNTVFFCEVIEHVKNPSLCLEEIRRVLSDGGKVFLSTPNPYMFRKCLRVLLGLPLVDGNVEHIAVWTDLELRNILRNAGFQNMQISYDTFRKRLRAIDRIAGLFSRRLGHRSIVAVAS